MERMRLNYKVALANRRHRKVAVREDDSITNGGVEIT